jgi:hypothetical protein
VSRPPKRATSFSASIALALAVAALLPATSTATITVGSDLQLPVTDQSDNCTLSTPPCTHLLVGVHPGNAFPTASPTSGTVVGFGLHTGVLSGASETVTFRLGRLEATCCGGAVGDGTGPTKTVHYPGTYIFSVSLPVKAGDYVGIDSSSTRAFADYPGNCAPGAGYFTYHPVLTNGGAFQPLDANSICELQVNMIIQPSNTLSFGRLKGNFKLGIVFLTVDVPGPGNITVGGAGIRSVRRASSPAAAVISKTVNEAGPVKLKIRAAGRARERLDSTGKVTVKAVITFSPIGGNPSTIKRKITLRKRL